MAEAPSTAQRAAAPSVAAESRKALERGELVALTWFLAVLAVLILILSFAGVGLGPGGLLLFRSPVWMWPLLAVFILGWVWAYGRAEHR